MRFACLMVCLVLALAILKLVRLCVVGSSLNVCSACFLFLIAVRHDSSNHGLRKRDGFNLVSGTH